MLGGMHLSLIALLPDFSVLPQSFYYIVVALCGGIIGSFLNVVIHRVPREESIVFPNSRCPSCDKPIAFYDNIPVLSYVLLGGKCRSCKTRISPRYPAVEALTALVWAIVFWRDGLTYALPFDLIFVTAIIALVFIDAEHMILPDVITKPGIVFAFVARLVVPYLMGEPFFDDVPLLVQWTGWPVPLASVAGGVIGALTGGGSLFLLGAAWKKLRNVEAMGLGDVKMMFMVGAYLGFRSTIAVIFLSALSGSIIGIIITIKERRGHLQSLLPYGVYLGIGSIVALLFGSRIVNWYLGFY